MPHLIIIAGTFIKRVFSLSFRFGPPINSSVQLKTTGEYRVIDLLVRTLLFESFFCRSLLFVSGFQLALRIYHIGVRSLYSIRFQFFYFWQRIDLLRVIILTAHLFFQSFYLYFRNIKQTIKMKGKHEKINEHYDYGSLCYTLCI